MSKRLIGTFDYWYDEDTKQFDPEKYDRMVRFQLGASPTRFEALVRMDLQREAMITLLVGGLDITESELKFHQKTTGDKVDLEYAAIDAETAAGLVKADEASVAAWLPANQESRDLLQGEHRRFERLSVSTPRHPVPRRQPARLEGEDEAEKAKLQKERDDAKAKAEAAYKKLAGERCAQSAGR